VQKQPYILLSSRELTSDVRERAKENGIREWEAIKSDTDERGNTKAYSQDDEMTYGALKALAEQADGTSGRTSARGTPTSRRPGTEPA
jgi:hypothetical protein